MSKLVVLNSAVTVRSHELKVDKTTIGRVDDNTFQIPDASVSSHHCEILLRGSAVVVKDLNSTNGTFINGTQITGESELKSGQTLRLGQVELRLENGAATAPAPTGGTNRATSTIQTGVSLNELQGGSTGFETASKGFTKKTNKGNRLFIIVVIVVGVVLAGVLVWMGMHIK
jgi:pSer/pThr/pTyr-binding forkhead associated (FHA) protein